MAEVDEFASQQCSPVRQSVSQQPRRWLRRNWDLAAVLLLVLASLPLEWLSPRTLFFVRTISLVDDSWHLDTCFKALRGLWLGRDVAFTYGPLFQWLASAPVRWGSMSMGAVYATWNLLPLWCTLLLGWLTLVLLLPEQPAWKRFLLLLLCVFWIPWEGRTPFAVFFFALFLRGWYALRQQEISPVLMGCGAAILCATAFLYSADAGAYAIAALLLSLVGVAWEGRREARILPSFIFALLACTGLSVVLVVTINAFMAKPLDFHFWKNSLAILAAYRWIEPASMTKVGMVRLFAALLVAGIVFLVRGVTARNRQLSITARSGFLLSGFVFSLFTLQNGLVRADWIHVVASTYPILLLTGVVLFSFTSRSASTFAVLFVVACSFLFGPEPVLEAARYKYGQLGNPLTECPSRFPEFDRVCFPEEFTGILRTTASYLQQSSGPRDSIVIFPYQTIFGIASRRNVAGGVMQSYLVSGPYLSQLEIAGLERAAAPSGLFLADGDRSGLIDGVPNFTRSPEVWLWMFRHYRREQELVYGILGLQKDDSRRDGIAMHLHPLNLGARSYPIPTGTAIVDLGDVTWPVVGADFLRLRLKLHYSFWWKLRKPASLVLEIERADSSYDRKPFIVEPNVSSEVWFYPWDDRELVQYFDADENNWRTGSRAGITHLRLLIKPFDWFSARPDRIEIQSAETVGVSMRQ